MVAYSFNEVFKDGFDSARYAGYKIFPMPPADTAGNIRRLIYKKIPVVKEFGYSWTKLIAELDRAGLFNGVEQAVIDSVLKSKYPNIPRPIPTAGFFIQVKINSNFRNIIYKGYYRSEPSDVPEYARFKQLLSLFYKEF